MLYLYHFLENISHTLDIVVCIFLLLLFVVYIMKLKSPTKEFVQSKNTTRGGGNTVDDVKLDDDPWRGLAATCWLVRGRWHAVKTVSTMARCWFSRLGAIFLDFFLQDVIFAQHYFLFAVLTT